MHKETLPVVLIIFVTIFSNISFFNPCTGALLNKVVLQNLNLKSKFVIDSSIWENNGFERATANTTKPFVSSTSTIVSQNLTSMFLVARKPAALSTVLHNFSHTFLCINFFSMIGKSINASITSVPFPIINTTITTATTTTTTTTTTTLPPIITTTTKEKPKEVKEPTIIKIIPESASQNNKNIDSQIAIQNPPEKPPVSDSSHIIEITLDHDSETKIEPSEASNNMPAAPIPQAAPNNGSGRRKRELDSKEISQVHEILNLALSNGNNNNDNNKSQTIVISSNDTLLSKQDDSQLLSVSTGIKTENQPASPNIPVIPDATDLNATAAKNHDDYVKPEVGILSYKDWKDSGHDLMKKPPGFYVLVNNQIVYDNWEGVWTGSNIMGKTIFNTTIQSWNETNIYIEMDSYVPHRDLNITFVWEPIDSSTFFFIHDISLGTLDGNDDQNLNPPAPAILQPAPDPLPIAPIVPPPPQPEPMPAIVPPVVPAPNNVQQPHTLFIVVKAQAPEPVLPPINNSNTIIAEQETQAIAVPGQNNEQIGLNSKNMTIVAVQAPDTPSIQTNITTIQKSNEETNLINPIIKSIGSNVNGSIPVIIVAPPPAPPSIIEYKTVKILNRDPNINNSESKRKADMSAFIVLGILSVLLFVIIVGVGHRKYKQTQNLPSRC